jgi:hypothetical protein
MADIPVTEKKLVELFKEFEARLDTKLDIKFNEKLLPIYTALNELRGFQKHESDAIELELELVIHKYLKEKYKTMNVTLFPAKKLYDPHTNDLITDLDAAFLIKELEYKPDIPRLRDAGLPIPKKLNIKKHSIFVLAEANHHMTKSKISTKLLQFDRICDLFNTTKSTIQSGNKEGYDEHFIKSLTHNKYFADIDNYILFFGSPFWERGLLKIFKEIVTNYKKLLEQFRNTSDATEKLNLYKDIITLEKEWYPNNKIYRTIMTDDDIIKCKEIHGAMEYVDFIYPSGERYHIEKNDKEPYGITHISLTGGSSNRKSRKHK